MQQCFVNKWNEGLILQVPLFLSLLSLSLVHTLCLMCVCVCVCVCDLLLFFFQLQLLLSVYKLHILGTHTVFTTLQIHKKMALDHSQAMLLTAIPRYKHTCTHVYNCVHVHSYTHIHTHLSTPFI